MSKLGDYFSDEERRKYIDRSLRSGRVLYLFCDDTTPPKEKYLVLVTDIHAPLLFLINSKIGPFILSRPHLLKCQVQINAAQNPYLDHDSFIDCSRVIEWFDEADIRRQVLDDTGRLSGELDPLTRQQVIRAVQQSDTISAHYQSLIVDALS